MSFIDWTVFALFLAYVIWDGIRRSRGTATLEGYFAGGRSIPWWAAGLSVMATQASAITVIGTTGQGHDGGMEFVQTYFGLPFAMVLLCIFMVPLYRKSPILTAYEFLERRYGPETRSLASLIFLVSRCLAFGLVILAPAIVLSQMLGWSIEVTVICVGALTTVYTMIGGVHAVIWTDVKQMLVILGGLLLCLGILLYHVLGQIDFGGALSVLGATGKLGALEVAPESTNFVPRLAGAEGPKSFWEEKYNVWSGLIGGLFLHLSYFGCDQSQVQRILTNPTARESRMALLMSAFAKVPMQLVVLFIGVLLYLFYALGGSPLLFNPSDREAAKTVPEIVAIQADYEAVGEIRRELALRLGRGEELTDEEYAAFRAAVQEAASLRVAAREAIHGEQASKKKDTNFIFPHFIFENLPPVLLGLIVAAIFAAAMSSSDSALNSLTAASVVDFYRRWVRPDASEAQSLRMSRFITVFWGVGATTAAIWLGNSGSVVEVINKVGSYFYGPLLGVFALAILMPRAGRRAGFLGLLGGMVSVLVVANTLEVAFLWYNVVGAVGVLAVGGGLGLVGLDRKVS